MTGFRGNFLIAIAAFLVALEKERHFGRAAEKCFVSQPSLSTALNQLEDELGVKIILRDHKFIGFTNYRSDVPDGPWVIWYPNSDQIQEQGFHQDGIKEGLTTYYYKDGTMQREGFFKNGLPDGLWTYWNAKGEKDFDFDFGTGLEHVALEDLAERESIFYKINDDKPFTGIITQENPETDKFV